MTIGEFLEFFSTNKYVSQPSTPSVGVHVMNTNPTQWGRNYGQHIFRIAYQYLQHVEASYIVRYQVLSLVLSKALPAKFSDKDVWDGNYHFDGLNTLTQDITKKVLTEPDYENVLSQDNTIPVDVVAREFPNIKTWWIKAVKRLKDKSLIAYKLAILQIPFEKNLENSARMLKIPVDQIHPFRDQVLTIVLDEIDKTEDQGSRLVDRRYITQKLGEVYENRDN